VLAQTLGGYGLAFPVGHCGSAAISGYLLGGGFGWNAGSWGVACHNVESVDVVLADGSLRRASATENPEIFWAVQGGGPAFFGVVVRYRLRLQALPRVMKASLRTYPLDRVGEVEAWLAASATAGPSNVERTIMMTAAPEPIAAQVAQVATGIATVFADDEAEADRLLADVGATAPLGALDVHEGIPVSFDMLYAISDGSHPAGARWAVDSFWGVRPGDGLVAALAERMARAPTPQSFALAAVEAPLPGPLPDAAFSMVGAVFGAAHAIWHDAADDADCVGWLRQTADAASAHAIGHYVGEADLDRPGRLAACYSPEAWEKLAALRLRYDPTGVFDRTGTGAAALRRAGCAGRASDPAGTAVLPVAGGGGPVITAAGSEE
jgi:FAD/FMN-containing dehydrogenase